MVDLNGVVGFDWDEGNSSKSTRKHAVTRGEAEQVFGNTPLLLVNDPAHSRSEARYHAYGKTDAGRLIQISFTLRQDGALLRVISARPMSARERARYGQEV
ncbi:BrnT family toxin [Rhodopseudomonas sp. NSM]|uniref:BrnT family toxin n=1 Tax=Rhodopseudomonas sp. NSM TaxID=3457630 RepID=UPI004035C17B